MPPLFLKLKLILSSSLHVPVPRPGEQVNFSNLLHGLTYAEQATWSQLVTIPRSGLLITPEQGEVFSLLRRDRPVG